MLAKEIHKDFQRERLAPHFVYESYDKTSGLFFNRASCGFVLIANPLPGTSLESQTEIADYVANSENLPDGSTLQVLMIGSSDVSFLLDRWERERTGDIYKEMAARRAKFFKDKAKEGLVKDNHILISVTIPDPNFAINLATSMIESLKSMLLAIGLFAESVDDYLLLSILRKIWGSDSLNFQVNPMEKLSSQILQSDFGIYEDDDIVDIERCESKESLICLEASGRPNSWNLILMDLFLGNEARRGEIIKSDYLIHTCIHILKNQTKAKLATFAKRESIGKNIKSGLGKFFPDLGHEFEDIDSAASCISTAHDRIVHIHSNIIFKGEKERVKKVAKDYTSFMRRNGWSFTPTKYNHLAFMLASLPMMFVEAPSGTFNKDQEGVGVCLSKMDFGKKTVSSEAKALLPLIGEYKGNLNAPGLLLSGRRGQIKYFSQFGGGLVPDLGKNGGGDDPENYNVCIGGMAGSGKSVIMEEIMLSTLGVGGKVFVLDHGKSFMNLCQELGGNHIQFDPSRPISINPFSNVPTGDDKVSTEARADFLASFPITLATMAAPQHGTSDLQQTLLSQALREVWAKKKNKTEIDDIASWLLDHNTDTAKDLGRMLFNYTSKGAYGGFFKGEAEVTLDARIAVIETDHLRNYPDFMSVVVQIMITHINNTMAKGRIDKPNLLVFDEMKKTLKSPLALEFVDEISRTVRKYNASVVVATQLLTDFSSLGTHAASIFEGAAFKLIMKQSPDTLRKMRSMPIFASFVESDARLRMMQSIKPKKGEYSEFTIWGGGIEGDICQLRLDPFTLLMMSTNATDKQMIADHRASGKSLQEAINSVLEEREQLK